MKKRIALTFLMMITMCIAVPLQAWFTEVDIDNIDHSHVKVLRTIESRFCYISFVRIYGKEYIVKQKKEPYLRKIVGPVRDTITAHIIEDFIEEFGEIAHRVAIISAGKKFPGKLITEWPATLHTIAPGKMIKELDTKYTRMDIKQGEIGFRREMLTWMTKHPVLLLIVAIDTFLCNHDRHRGNLFYLPSKDSFCAIDMDSSYKHNLCAFACKNFSAMIGNKNLRLKKEEIAALKKYKEYIEYLIEAHPMEMTLDQYNFFAEQAGFVPGAELYTQKVELELERNRRMIKESYKDVQRLIPILEKLIKVSTKRLTQIL